VVTQKKQVYEDLIDNLNDAVYTVDVESLKFTSVNKAGEKLTGYNQKELIKTPISNVIPEKYSPIVKKMIARKNKKDTSTIYEIEIKRKDGLMIPVEISSRAEFKDGVPVTILGIARDITNRKLHQQERDIFIGLITHEIKNPLTTIKLYTELLQKKYSKKDQKTAEAFSTISDSVLTIEELMNDFLGVTQMQLGKFIIRKEVFDLNEVVDRLISYYKRYSPHKIMRVGKVKHEVFADKNRISQVISNLLSNAIKYSADAKKILIHLNQTEKEVIVKVEDFGVGIPKEELKQIFELFTRTKHATQSNIKGHGLGLYFSREIIKYHKGKIWVETVLGKGSKFIFKIPFK
jgi:PAS domain S-box-containing protein